MYSIFIALVLFLSPTLYAHKVNNTNGYEVSLVGASGKLRLTHLHTDRWVQLAWSKLEEVDTNGNVVKKVNNFASINDFAWSAPHETTVDGLDAITSTIAGNVQIGNQGSGAQTAYFALTIYTFQTTVFITTGATAVIVPHNTIKFNIICNDWPFESQSNRLNFGVTLMSHKAANVQHNETSVNAMYDSNLLALRSKVVTFGDGGIISPPLAVLDGVDKNITISVTDNELKWSFPAFVETLLYDPILALEGVPSSGVGVTVGYPTYVVLMICIFLFC
jgi:hypothetical protein